MGRFWWQMEATLTNKQHSCAISNNYFFNFAPLEFDKITEK